MIHSLSPPKKSGLTCRRWSRKEIASARKIGGRRMEEGIVEGLNEKEGDMIKDETE